MIVLKKVKLEKMNINISHLIFKVIDKYLAVLLLVYDIGSSSLLAYNGNVLEGTINFLSIWFFYIRAKKREGKYEKRINELLNNQKYNKN